MSLVIYRCYILKYYCILKQNYCDLSQWLNISLKLNDASKAWLTFWWKAGFLKVQICRGKRSSLVSILSETGVGPNSSWSCASSLPLYSVAEAQKYGADNPPWSSLLSCFHPALCPLIPTQFASTLPTLCLVAREGKCKRGRLGSALALALLLLTARRGLVPTCVN